MEKKFDEDEARDFLLAREAQAKQERELLRQEVLKNALQILQDMFLGTETEIYLVGSVTKPYQFYKESDVDIVLKNFRGDRFKVWTELEEKLSRKVEVILYEHSHFQEHIDKEGLKVR